MPVKEQDGAMFGDPAQFRTTRWSGILVAAKSRISGSDQALSDRFRKQFATLLHQEITRTVSVPAEIDEEIRDLGAALAPTEGQI